MTFKVVEKDDCAYFVFSSAYDAGKYYKMLFGDVGYVIGVRIASYGQRSNAIEFQN